MSKCLEAVYIAENQVVNGCTGTHIKVASDGNLLCPSTILHCLIHLWVSLRKFMGGRRIILVPRKMLNKASHVVFISRRKETEQTSYNPCWEWFCNLSSQLFEFLHSNLLLNNAWINIVLFCFLVIVVSNLYVWNQLDHVNFKKQLIAVDPWVKLV